MVKCIDSINSYFWLYLCHPQATWVHWPQWKCCDCKVRIWCDERSEKGCMIFCITGFENVDFILDMTISKSRLETNRFRFHTSFKSQVDPLRSVGSFCWLQDGSCKGRNVSHEVFLRVERYSAVYLAGPQHHLRCHPQIFPYIFLSKEGKPWRQMTLVK